MKYFIYFSFYLFFIDQVNGQIPVWNIEATEYRGGVIPHVSIQLRGDKFLFYSQKQIMELNSQGIITTGASSGYYIQGYGEFIKEKIDPQTGQPYFLLVSSGPAFSGGLLLNISEYYPDVGFTYGTYLSEEESGIARSPFFIARNDSVFFILGKKYFRQVTYHADHSLVVDWQQDNTIGTPSGGVLIDDGLVGITYDGQIFALDTLGNILWNNPAPTQLNHLEKTEDGYLACNRALSPSLTGASVIKFTSNGTIDWDKSFSDRTYEFLLVEADGSITVTGQDSAYNMVLHHLDHDGNTIWRKTYQKGTGVAILRTPDNGYLFAGVVSGLHFAMIKTDNFGTTSPVIEYRSLQNRKIENDILSSVFIPAATVFSNNTGNSFFVPKENKTSIFYAAAPWIGGLDQEDSLHLSVATYAYVYRGSDYRAGIAQTSNNDLNRVWSVSRSEIEALQQDWLDDGLINEPVPYDILTWPAKGNLDFKYNIAFAKTTINKDLLPAPFIDVNGDGKYSIYDGDYPRIKGDQMAWWVFTDSTTHQVNNGRVLLLDIYASAYLYNCGEVDKLNNSLFVDFDIINRSNNSYKNVFAGLWSDPDIGCPNDDFVGTLPALNAFYGYNQDNEDSPCNEYTAFGTTIPVGSVAFTNATLDKSIYYNNGSVMPLPLPETSDPSSEEEYNNYLQGKWKDGTIPTYNGQPIDYAFPDNPADPTGNSMCYAGGTFPAGDRRMIGSHGPFDFAPGDTFQLHVAFTYHPDIPLPCPDIFGTVKNDLELLQNLVHSGALDAPANLPTVVHLSAGQSILLDATVPGATAYNWSNGATTPVISINQTGNYTVTITRVTGCSSVEMVVVQSTTSSETPTLRPDQFRLFPNPTSGQFTAELQGLRPEKVVFTLINAIGQIVQSQTVNSSSGTLRQVFDYGQLPIGIYTLRVHSGEKALYKKLIIQR